MTCRKQKVANVKNYKMETKGRRVRKSERDKKKEGKNCKGERKSDSHRQKS